MSTLKLNGHFIRPIVTVAHVAKKEVYKSYVRPMQGKTTHLDFSF